MHFSLYAATCLALVGRAFAQTDGFDAITAPTRDQTLTAGTTSTVTWDYNPQYEGTVTITLLQGATPETLQVGSAIASKFSRRPHYQFSALFPILILTKTISWHRQQCWILLVEHRLQPRG
jgi:hypothetical protein